jgi:cobalamin biosynthesis protein CobC
MDMMSHARDRRAALPHGGDLGFARGLFPGAPEPFVDLSTGINPFHYPIGEIPAEALTRLPQPLALERLAAVAAEAYGAPSRASVVPAPGSQILLPLVAALVVPGQAKVLDTTYAEHVRAAGLAGHAVVEAGALDELADCDIAIVSNPNNPDGRLLSRQALLDVAAELERRRGLLVVDEAFMDVGPLGASLAADTERPNIIVLRSFGKFFGLPGVRLGFAIANPAIAAALTARLGPWAVSGPAIAIGQVALADQLWSTVTRVDLAAHALALDQLLLNAGLEIVGGTSLFRLVASGDARGLFCRLGVSGIFVRPFDQRPTWLRFGLPGSQHTSDRLEAALRPPNSDRAMHRF